MRAWACQQFPSSIWREGVVDEFVATWVCNWCFVEFGCFMRHWWERLEVNYKFGSSFNRSYCEIFMCVVDFQTSWLRQTWKPCLSLKKKKTKDLYACAVMRVSVSSSPGGRISPFKYDFHHQYFFPLESLAFQLQLQKQ